MMVLINIEINNTIKERDKLLNSHKFQDCHQLLVILVNTDDEENTFFIKIKNCYFKVIQI